MEKSRSGIWEKLYELKNYDQAIRIVGGTGNSFCSSKCKCQVPEGFSNLLNKYRNTKEASKTGEVNGNLLSIDNTNGAKAIHECKAYWDDQTPYTKAFLAMMGEIEN